MKKDFHPKQNLVIFRDAEMNTDFVCYSTVTSEIKEKYKGQDAYVVLLDVSSASHPFFTGTQKLVDTSGRIKKYEARMAKLKKAA